MLLIDCKVLNPRLLASFYLLCFVWDLFFVWITTVAASGSSAPCVALSRNGLAQSLHLLTDCCMQFVHVQRYMLGAVGRSLGVWSVLRCLACLV